LSRAASRHVLGEGFVLPLAEGRCISCLWGASPSLSLMRRPPGAWCYNSMVRAEAIQLLVVAPNHFGEALQTAVSPMVPTAVAGPTPVHYTNPTVYPQGNPEAAVQWRYSVEGTHMDMRLTLEPWANLAQYAPHIQKAKRKSPLSTCTTPDDINFITVNKVSIVLAETQVTQRFDSFFRFLLTGGFLPQESEHDFMEVFVPTWASLFQVFETNDSMPAHAKKHVAQGIMRCCDRAFRMVFEKGYTFARDGGRISPAFYGQACALATFVPYGKIIEYALHPPQHPGEPSLPLPPRVQEYTGGRGRSGGGGRGRGFNTGRSGGGGGGRYPARPEYPPASIQTTNSSPHPPTVYPPTANNASDPRGSHVDKYQRTN
jgi:hypothetical protein